MMVRVLFVALIVAMATAFNVGRMGKKFVFNFCISTVRG